VNPEDTNPDQAKPKATALSRKAAKLAQKGHVLGFKKQDLKLSLAASFRSAYFWLRENFVQFLG
jgi:hypothetical protein